MYFHSFLPDQLKFRLKQLQHALFTEFVDDWEEITVFSKDLREQLKAEPIWSFAVTMHKQDVSAEKMLFKMKDGNRAETVLIKHEGRNTVCVSSQVGCAANCSFCATGALGFRKHLTEREIVEQVRWWSVLLKKRWMEDHPGQKWHLATTPPQYRVRNVVYMGMGEPLLNWEGVSTSVATLESSEGYNLGLRHITVSTVGIATNIPRFLDLERMPNLAVSLHAATDELRNKLVPTNRGFPLEKLMAALDEFVKKTGRRVFYEWAVLRGVNDTKEQMETVVELLKDRQAHMNFIPWNPGPSRVRYERPSIDHVRKMQQYLVDNGVPCTIRMTHGDEVGGACGQLAYKE